jgi:alpha-glucosidase
LKFGFVNGLTQTGRKFTLNMLKKAGDYGFGVIIHDNLRPSGTEQTYLNHLSTEGLRGNEYVTNTAAHTTVLPFSRFMIGAGDYTFCYKNPDNSTLPNMPVSKGHQLAISVAFFSPIQSIMWYGKPEDYTDSVEIEFFKHLPVYWEDSKLLDGAIGRYAVFARKSHDRWFWSAYSYQPLNIRQSCSFLGNDSIYIRTCYRDSAGTISKKKDFVNRFITSYYSLNSNTGCACIFEKTDSVSQVPAISFVPVQDTVHINDTLKYVVFFEKIPPAFTAKSIKIYATFEPNAFQIFDFKSKYFNDNALHIKTEDNHTLITYNQDQPIIFSDTILNFLCIINRNNSFLIDSVYVDENKILVFQKFPCISENTQPINNFASCNFSIYPTLVTDRSINLSFTHPGKYDIKITDITGKIVISKQVDIPFNNQITLDLLPLKKGLYIVKVKSCPYTKKFVIL